MAINVAKEIKKLSLPDKSYVVFAGGVLSAHGIRETEDIDLFVLPEVYEKFKKEGWEVEIKNSGIRALKSGVFEIYNDISTKDYKTNFITALKNSELINGIRYMSLPETILYKKSLGRPKDFADIVLIENFLKK
ncbi:MAG: zinc ABC transporter substrate-binding protein [Candidatus Paceibacterota bacterium]